MNGGKKFLTPPQGRASPQDLIEYERARTEFITSRKRYTDISSRIPHTDKIRDLFQKWAPFYDTYMRLTNHEGAAREVIRQLTAMGYFKNQRVFMGKGMDLGGGTGLITREIGYRALRKALVRLKDNPQDPNISNFIEKCLRQQSRIINLIEDPVRTEVEDPHIGIYVLAKLRKMLEKDMENKYIAGFKHCQFLSDLLNRRTGFTDILDENNIVVRESGSGTEHIFDLRPLLLGYISDMLSLVAKETADEFHSSHGTNAADFLKKRLSDVVDITVVDISQPMLEIAREKVRPVYLGLASDMFIEGDATRLPELSEEHGWHNSFDFVVISQLLHLMPDEGRLGMLKGVHEILKPEGKLVVVDEWSPLYSGRSQMSDDLEVLIMLEQIKETFHDIFHPKERGDMRSLIEKEGGFYYSGKRASHPIDEDHRMFAHLYIKKSKTSIPPRSLG